MNFILEVKNQRNLKTKAIANGDILDRLEDVLKHGKRIDEER